MQIDVSYYDTFWRIQPHFIAEKTNSYIIKRAQFTSTPYKTQVSPSNFPHVQIRLHWRTYILLKKNNFTVSGKNVCPLPCNVFFSFFSFFVFSLNKGKYRPEKIRLRTLFTQCIKRSFPSFDSSFGMLRPYGSGSSLNEISVNDFSFCIIVLLRIGSGLTIISLTLFVLIINHTAFLRGFFVFSGLPFGTTQTSCMFCIVWYWM